MNLKRRELGVVQVILQQFNNVELPRLIRIQEKIDGGEVLGDFDIFFLEHILDELRLGEELAKHHREYQNLIFSIIKLLHHITETAVKNETK